MPGAIPPCGLVTDGQFDICLGCHGILAINNKNICGYSLRNIDIHQLEGFDLLAKDSEVNHSMKLKMK